jgi:archaellum component FlaC
VETDELEMDEHGIDRRLSALERWRDVIDNERGQIMGELGEIKGLMSGVGTQMAGIVTQLEGIREQLEERPSRSEYKETERQIESIRAKTTTGLLSKLEVTGPGGMTFKLFGVSGVTIVLVFFLIVMILALWILRK